MSVTSRFKASDLESFEQAEDPSRGVRSTRLTTGSRQGRKAILDSHLLLARRGRAGETIAHLYERHALLMLPRQRFLQLFKRAGLAARFLPEGLTPKRGLFVAVKNY